MQKIKQPRKQSIFISLALFSLISTGCVPKDANGRYSSVYSYHPYIKDNSKKIISKQKEIKNHFPTVYLSKYRPQKNKVTLAKHNPPKINNPFTGYQKKRTLSAKPSTAIINKIEKTAKSLLGTDYQYGANGPYKYDCSSFTKYVFEKQGITLPRVSREQAKKGQFVTARQLKKGDLIFFDSKKSKEVSHVGIYLGRGDFIHASSAQDEVTISNLNSNYYSKHFKWGRRVTNINYAMR